MDCITLKADENLINRVMRHYSSQEIESLDFDFCAKTLTCTVSIFEDEILFEGHDALIHASLWSKKHKTLLEKKQQNPHLNEHVGIACCGHADLFGPMVSVACYVNEEDIDYINHLDIPRLSELTTPQIIEYTKLLINRITHTITLLDNSHYNKLATSATTNAIRTLITNESIVKMVRDCAKKNIPYVSNDYVQKKTYLNYLKNTPSTFKNVQVSDDAINYVAFKVASILASYSYLSYLQKMSKAVGCKLPRGMQQSAYDKALDLSTKHGESILYKTIKLNVATKQALNITQ